VVTRSQVDGLILIHKVNEPKAENRAGFKRAAQAGRSPGGYADFSFASLPRLLALRFLPQFPP